MLPQEHIDDGFYSYTNQIHQQIRNKKDAYESKDTSKQEWDTAQVETTGK